jgi:hypothetical protein
MVKHTCKQFLYGREHVRVPKCPETRAKPCAKTGLKRGPSQHLKSRKHPYTGKSANGGTPKTRSKNDPKMMGKSTCKIAFGTMGTRSHFSKAGISLNSIWRPIFKNPQKTGPNTVFARRGRRLTSNGIPQKRGPKRGQKHHPKVGRKSCQKRILNPPKSEDEKPPKSRARSGQIFCQTTSRGRGTFKEERLNIVQFLK